VTTTYHSGDWHLPPRPGRPGWGGIPECADDVWLALEDLVDKAVTAYADLTCAGDVFDGPNVAAEVLKRLRGVLDRFGDSGGILFYVLGNHDAGQDWLACLPRTVRVDATPKTHPNSAVVGADFREDFAPPSYVDGEVPAVGLYHQPWLDWTARGRYRLADLPAHRLAVCGDIHVAHLAQPPTGPAYALSPGPLVPQKVDEIDSGYGLAWRWDGLLPPVSEPLPCRRTYHRLAVDPANPESALAEAHAIAEANPGTAPVPAILFECPAFPAGYQKTARALAARASFLAGFRHAGATGTAPAAIAEVRRQTRRGLADAVAAWPTLAADDVGLARKLADPTQDPGRVLSSVRPEGSP
jgi:hypothetical protein